MSVRRKSKTIWRLGTLYYLGVAITEFNDIKQIRDWAIRSYQISSAKEDINLVLVVVVESSRKMD